jgi:ribosomal protein S18 acetylase RimI-like enzyme
VTELTGIAVIPCARRRGVGSELTTALVEDAVAGGAEVVFLSAADQTAAGLYRRLGFVEVATACIAGPPG